MHRSQGRDSFEQLDSFFQDGYIDEVLGLVRAGKEATVYCCRAGSRIDADLVAAKVYRGRQYRFKNDAVYQEARSREMGLRGRALRAMTNKSSFGREVQAGSWRHREYETLELLYNAGSDVPQPYTAGEEVILMQYFGNEDEAAPQLSRVHIDTQEAGPMFQRLMNNVELWLALDRVHGDLSPHNVLYFEGEPRIIDFPQATDPRFNNSARELLFRDIDNLVRYFQPYGVDASAEVLADDLWRRFMRAEL